MTDNNTALKDLYDEYNPKLNLARSYSEFEETMKDPSARKDFYDSFNSELKLANSYNEFESVLGISSPKPLAPSTKGGESGAVKTPSTSTSVLEDLESGSWTKTISPNKQEQPVSKPVIEVPKSVKQVEEVKPITSKDFQIKQGAIPDFTTERVDRSEKGFNKSLFDNYNSSFENYKSISDAASFHKKNIIQKSKSSKGVLDGFEEFISPQKAKIAEEYRRKELESQLSSDPLMQKLNSESKKAKSRFDYYTKSATEEIDRQLDAIANKNGGWDKFVKPLGEADVDKVRNAVDDFLVNNDINPDSHIAYKMRNEMKAKAEFKKIEPQVNTEFEINYKKKYGVTPDEDLQKEYGLKANEITGIKQAKDELEKRRALESQSLKAEFQPQINAYDEEYKTKLNALNSKVESDPELNNYANSLYKENFSKYQSLVNQGAMSAEQANQEMNSPQNLESINAKVIEKANEKYGKDFEAELTTYQKQLNELNSRYNSIYRRQESARLEQANKKIESELNKFKGSFKPSKEILERREKAYSDAYNIVGGKYSKAQENVTRELGHLRQTQALLSGLGGGLKSYGQYFDNKFLYDMGESIEANNLLKIPESKNFSDWLDVDKLVVGTGNIVGRMIPMIGVSTATGFITRNWSATAQMATIGLTGWVTEGADMAGSIKGEVLEKTGDPVKADEAVKSMWQSHVYSMPLYAFSGLPFVNGLPTKIAKRIAPSLFKEVGKGTRRTFGQYLKQTAAAAAVSSIGETAEEIPQEFKQGIDEEAIRNGAEIKSISDQLRILKQGASWKRFGETVVQVAPSTFVMGSTPVFLSESTKYAKEKYYERSVDNYINGLSISEALETSPEQYIYNTLRDKGKNFTSTLINTLYTSGNIDEQTYDKLAGKLQDMDNFQNFLSKNKLEASSTTNIIGYKLHEQYQQAKKDLEDSTDELGKDILKDRVKKAKDEFDSFYKGEGVNAVVLTMGNGSQYVFSTEEMDSLLQFENIRNGIRNKTIGVTVYNRKGQKAFMETTLDEINIVFKEEPLEEELTTAEGEVVLTKNTSPTSDKYGTINRNDGKGVVDLTKEEFEAEQAKMQPKVDEQVAPTAEQPKTEEEKPLATQEVMSNEKLLANLPSESEASGVFEDRGTLKNAPVTITVIDRYGNKNRETRYIPWSIHEKANKNDTLGGQTAREIAQRGGYSDSELDGKYPNWRKELAELSTPTAEGEQADKATTEFAETKFTPIPNPTVVITGLRNGFETLSSNNPPQEKPKDIGRGRSKDFDKDGILIDTDSEGNKTLYVKVDAADAFGRAGNITVQIKVPNGSEVNQVAIKKIIDEQVEKMKSNNNIDLRLDKISQSDFDGLKNAIVEEVEKPTIITDEKEPIKKEDGEPMSGGVQGVRTEGQEGKESAELRPEEEEVADPLKDVESTAKALEGVDKKEIEQKVLPNVIDIYKIQDDGAERILERSFKPNRVWVYKIENAGDIIRELSKYKNEFLDPSYIYEKVNKIEKFLKEQQNQLKVSPEDSYFQFKRQNEESVKDFISAYENLPTISEAQSVAKKMVLGLLNGNIDEAQKGIDYFNEIRKADDIKAELQKRNKYQISEAYHKAKAGGSNPELVKAVEELLGKPKEATPQAGSVVGGEIKSNWNYEGEGDAFASNKDSRDGKSAYTIRILDRNGRGSSYNRAKQRGELDTKSPLTYEGDKESISAIDGNGNTVGVIKLQTDGGVEHIVVAPEFSRKGVASELIKQIKQKGAKVNFEKSKLISPDAAKLFNKIRSEQSLQPPTTEEKVSGGLTQEEKANLENISKDAGVNFQEVRNVYNKYGEGKPLNEITLEDYQKAEEKRQGGKKVKAEESTPTVEEEKPKIQLPKTRKERLDSLREKAKKIKEGKPIDDAAERVASALKESGIRVEIIDSEEDYNREAQKRGGGKGTEGMFISTDGVIYLNKNKLQGGWGTTIVWHEGTHPIINIIRNTNPDLFNKIVSGAKRLTADKGLQNALKFAEAYRDGMTITENSEGKFELYDGENLVDTFDSEKAAQDYIDAIVTDEFIVEAIARIVDGKINIEQFPSSLRQSIVDLINNILNALGIKARVSDTDIAQFKKLAAQVSDVLQSGRSISEIVGKENVKNYGNFIGEPIQLSKNIRPNIFKQKVEVNPNGHRLSFVKKSDLIDIESLIKDILSKNQKVWFWTADQLGRGIYSDETFEGEHYLDAGPSFALDPKNKKSNIIWASGADLKSLMKRIGSSDYIFIISGSPQKSKLFNKEVIKLLGKRIDKSAGDWSKFRDNIIKKTTTVVQSGANKGAVKTNIITEIIKKYESLDDLIESKGTDKKTLFIELEKQRTETNTPLKKYLDEIGLTFDVDSLRDGFYKDNDFDINDIMLVLKATGAEAKKAHGTYENSIIGNVIGVPDKKVNAIDILPEEKKKKFTEAQRKSPMTGAAGSLIAQYSKGQREGINWETSIEGKGDPTISSRNPIVQKAAANLKAGKITNEEYRAIASENSPIRPITRFFEPASENRIKSALSEDKIDKVNIPVEDGKDVGLRLDIPAYKNNNTWVVSVHEGTTNAGKAISYTNVAKIKDVKFGVEPKGALAIAAGIPKTTIGRMFGKWENIEGETLEEKGDNAKKLVEDIINDPNYVQVGMNPFRHSYFYDRSSDIGRPIVSADEVIQIGGLVYAKNPIYGNWTDEAYRVKDLFDKSGKPVQFSKGKRMSDVENFISSSIEEGYALDEVSEIVQEMWGKSETEANELIDKYKSTKTTEDAVQKQAAGQVPIQPKAGVSEEVEGGKPETKSEKATKESQKEIDELFDLYESIDESKGLDKRKAADDFRNMQQSIKNPTLKRIFDNISNIHSQLEKQGLITKTKGCP